MRDKDENVVLYLKEKAKLIDAKLKEYLGDKNSPQYLKTILGRTAYIYDDEAIDKSILNPAWHLLESGGKRLRSALALVALELFRKKSEDYIEFSVIPEIVHNATLIHDDIEDRSEKRRNKLSIHKEYGLDIALNLGDFMFFFPMNAILGSKKIDQSTKIKLLNMYAIHMQRLGIGQGIDLAWHNQLVDISKRTIDNYLQVAFDKTGALVSMALQTGAIIGGADQSLVDLLGNFGAVLGVAFQIRDDILNITKSGVSESKGDIGEDISEGKVTLLTIHTIQNGTDSEKRRMVEILKMHTTDPKLIREAISIIKCNKSIEYAEKFADKLIHESWAKLDARIPDCEAKSMLKAIAEFTINRTI
jgi:geranylgeranyl pyrophosphate synthase